MIPTKQEFHRALAERIGEERFAKFQQASVAICGLGGLGSNIAIALARAGIGRLHLMDFDKVDISNLNRQQYKASQLGMYKTEALKENLLEIMPYCDIVTDTLKITEEHIPHIFSEESIICEAFDVAENKAMLVNGVLEQLPEKYIVSGSGMAGFAPANTIRTQKMTSHFFLCGDRTSDVADGIGLVSSRVMLCAAHQAHAVLQIIAGEAEFL